MYLLQDFSYSKIRNLSKRNKLKASFGHNMIDLITFLDTNGKHAVYKGGIIHGLYSYLEMIGAPTTLTTSVQSSDHFGP